MNPRSSNHPHGQPKRWRYGPYEDSRIPSNNNSRQANRFQDHESHNASRARSPLTTTSSENSRNQSRTNRYWRGRNRNNNASYPRRNNNKFENSSCPHIEGAVPISPTPPSENSIQNPLLKSILDRKSRTLQEHILYYEFLKNLQAKDLENTEQREKLLKNFRELFRSILMDQEQIGKKVELLEEENKNLRGEILKVEDALQHSMTPADQVPPPPNADEADANEATLTPESEIKNSEPTVSKETCKQLFNDSQQQLAQFLPLYLPKLYILEEIIRGFERNAKSSEGEATIEFLWQGKIQKEVYVKEFEKGFSTLRNKTTRKIYECLRNHDGCIMSSAGSIYGCKWNPAKTKLIPVVSSFPSPNLEWDIPNGMKMDYMVVAKNEAKVNIYKIDLTNGKSEFLYTKRV